MYSNLGNGFNYVRLNRNKFEGTYTRFNIKCSSSCVVEINDNDFGVNNSYLLDISSSGYTPKIMRVNNNILNGGNIIASLPAGTALTGPYNYLEMIGNFIGSSTLAYKQHHVCLGILEGSHGYLIIKLFDALKIHSEMLQMDWKYLDLSLVLLVQQISYGLEKMRH